MSLSRSPSAVTGLWMPGVSTNTTWASGRLSTPRTCVRVVCGLSETMLTLCPQMALSSVDLPTLGRPTSVTKPERIAAHGAGASAVRSRPAAGVDRAPALMRRPSTCSAAKRVAVDLDALALGGTWPSVRTGSRRPCPSRRRAARRSSSSLTSSTARPPSTRSSPSASRSTSAVLDVVLVDDLADQLLDAVLQGDQPGGAAVLVDDDGHVELARPASRASAGPPAWSRARSGRGGPGRATGWWPRALALGPHEVLGVGDARRRRRCPRR